MNEWVGFVLLTAVKGPIRDTSSSTTAAHATWLGLLRLSFILY